MVKQTHVGNRQAASVKRRVTGTGRKKRATGKRSAVRDDNLVCTAEQRHQMICEQAWFLAEQRGFRGDCALDDWLQAEAIVDAANISRAVTEDRDNAI